MLEEGIKTLALRRKQPHGQVHQNLADELSVAGSTLYAWRRGEHLPPPHVVARLVEIFVEQGGMDERWFERCLEKGMYGPSGAVDALREKLFGRLQKEGGKHEPSGNPAPLSKTGSSWTGRIFDRVLSLGEYFQAEDFLKLAGGLLLWLGVWGGVNRFFRWPFPNEQTLLAACIRYGLVSLGAPPLVALLAGLNEQDVFKTLPLADRRPLWILRMAAAYIGYYFAMVIGWGIAIFLYSVGVPVAVWVRAAIPALALFLGYVFAREYPLRRIEARTGRLLYFRGTDDFVLGLFFLFAPLSAILFYFLYPSLLRPYWGGLLLGGAFVLAAGEAFIEKRTGRILTHWVMVTLLLPLFVFLLVVLVLAVLARTPLRGN
ncbi:MAG: hypothetical protein D6796_11115 [Caldilineae bacterium]|nr:MAG: hypothetical protein D6796_11115 [Caldilineae bacterium]